MITQGATVSVVGQGITISGPRGSSTFTVPEGVNVKQSEDRLSVTVNIANDRSVKALSGLTRALLANMVKGVTTGFEKKLELTGVGYRAQMQGAELVLSLGFSHPVKFKALEGVTLEVKDNVITVSGFDKTLVGQQAAQIRAVKPPEPYKGKGIKYQGEKIRRKAGKAAKAGAK